MHYPNLTFHGVETIRLIASHASPIPKLMTLLLFAGPSPSLANRFGLRRSHPSPIEKTNSQSVSFNLNGTQLRLAKLHVTHSKDETGPCEWAMTKLRDYSNLFILNNMAERVGFSPGVFIRLLSSATYR